MSDPQPILTQEELLSKRSKRSRGRGRGFETIVVKRLIKWGYNAKKVVLSGATKKKPYDVLVSPFRLKLEAKRRHGEGIIIEAKWLNKIAPKYAVTFAAGARISQTVRICAISQANGTDNMVEVEIPGKSKTFGAVDGKFVVRRAKALGDLVIEPPFLILHDGKKFLVEYFEDYMSKNWGQHKEKKDVGTTA